MQDTPDISKIVGLIMQNPSLIEEIASLAKNESREAPADTSVAAEDTPVEVTASAEPERNTPSRAHRHELLRAMKPYLSESRRNAIDSMSSILDVLDVMIKR